MKKVVEQARFLFPETEFVIDWENKILIEMNEKSNGIENSWTDYVIDWAPFKQLIRNGWEKCETIILKFAPDKETLAFYNPEVGMGCFVPAKQVLSNLPVRKEEENKMGFEERANAEITSEEQVEKLQKELARLRAQIDRQKEYNAYKKGADSLALVIKALVDAGFSRSEAMELVKMSLDFKKFA